MLHSTKIEDFGLFIPAVLRLNIVFNMLDKESTIKPHFQFHVRNYKNTTIWSSFFQGSLDKNDVAGLPVIGKVDEVGFHLYDNTPAFVSQACITTPTCD